MCSAFYFSVRYFSHSLQQLLRPSLTLDPINLTSLTSAIHKYYTIVCGRYVVGKAKVVLVNNVRRLADCGPTPAVRTMAAVVLEDHLMSSH
jgi:hypothetical protein